MGNPISLSPVTATSKLPSGMLPGAAVGAGGVALFAARVLLGEAVLGLGLSWGGLALLLLLGFLVWHFATYPLGGNAPGFTIWPGLGTLPGRVMNLHRLHDKTVEVLSACPNMAIFGTTPGLKEIFTANPEHLQHILKDNFSNYPKGAIFCDALRELLGHGIFATDGEQWRHQRKVASYEFSTNALRNCMLATFQDEAAKRLLPTLDLIMARGTHVDMQDMFSRYTLDNICRVGFGTDPATLGPDFPEVDYVRAFDRASEVSMVRSLLPAPLWKAMRALRLGPEARLAKDIVMIDRFAYGVVESRRAALKAGNAKADASPIDVQSHAHTSDLLSQMILLGDNDHGELYDDRFLRDACLNFILAGRDTTTTALSWLTWLLSEHPEIEAKMLAEIEAVRAKRQSKESGENGESCAESGDSNGESLPLNFEELKSLTYAQAVLQECLRLYPPVPLEMKTCVEDDTFPDGTRVGRGWRVFFSIYAVGRMTRVWGPDAAEFRPERWFTPSGQLRTETAFKFPVFNGGPRLCLGKDLVFMQIKSVMSTLLPRYRFELKPGYNVTYRPGLTLFVKGGLPMRVLPRKAQAASC